MTLCIYLLPVLQEWIQDVYPGLPEWRRFGVQDSPLSLLCSDERRVWCSAEVALRLQSVHDPSWWGRSQNLGSYYITLHFVVMCGGILSCETISVLQCALLVEPRWGHCSTPWRSPCSKECVSGMCCTVLLGWPSWLGLSAFSAQFKFHFFIYFHCVVIPPPSPSLPPFLFHPHSLPLLPSPPPSLSPPFLLSFLPFSISLPSSSPPSLLPLPYLDQNHRKHIVQTFKPTPESSSFQRPQSDMNVASGCPQFTKLSTLDDDNYVKDDVMYIKCIVDTSRIFHPWLGDQKLKPILTSRHGLVMKLGTYQIWVKH